MELYKVVWKKHPEVAQVESGLREQYTEVSLLWCEEDADINELLDEVGDPGCAVLEPLESGFFMTIEMPQKDSDEGTEVSSIYLEAAHNNIAFLDDLKETRKRVLSND